jgi:hypothetical protein
MIRERNSAPRGSNGGDDDEGEDRQAGKKKRKTGNVRL